uniref:Uncharacterized protein n=1 Tax=Anguilla anguilla TaxID=7936 RepID=A0A0E9VP06_ANGAN
MAAFIFYSESEPDWILSLRSLLALNNVLYTFLYYIIST